jgi:hypothetical protein
MHGIVGVTELLTCRRTLCLMGVMPGGRGHLDRRGCNQRRADDGEDDLSHGRFPLLHAYPRSNGASRPACLRHSDGGVIQ